MSVVTITEAAKAQWDEFVADHAADGGLLQSWAWGDFQKALGNKVYRLASVDHQGRFQAAALVIRYELHFEYNYLYCPRGPVLVNPNVTQLTAMLAAIKKIAAEEKSFMIRLEPAWPVGQEQFLIDAGLRKSESELQPKCSFTIAIDADEADLLAAMKQKTRYNINLAEKKAVQILISDEQADLEVLWQLMKQTTERSGFKPHSKEHYKKMFELLSPGGTLKLFLASYEQHTIAAALISFFGQTATYLHGASADLYRGAMAPYLLHFQAIRAAKDHGCSYYDFGGVNGETYHNEKWAGITRFKTGFNETTKPTEFVGSFELVLSPFVFAAYKFVKQIRG